MPWSTPSIRCYYRTPRSYWVINQRLWLAIYSLLPPQTPGIALDGKRCLRDFRCPSPDLRIVTQQLSLLKKTVPNLPLQLYLSAASISTALVLFVHPGSFLCGRPSSSVFTSLSYAAVCLQYIFNSSFFLIAKTPDSFLPLATSNKTPAPGKPALPFYALCLCLSR